MADCPFFPTPSQNKANLVATFLFKRRSWLDSLYEKSYHMKAGRVRMPGFDLHIINDSKEVKKIMTNQVKEFPKSQLLHELLKPLLGESIFTTNGETWQKQRELLRPSFEMTRISKVFGLMNEAALLMMQSLERYPKGAVIEIDKHMTFVTADVIFRTILSKELGEEQGKKLLDAFALFQEKTLHTGLQKMFCFPKWMTFFLSEYQRIKAGRYIRNTLAQIIRPRYEQKESSTHQDILSSLLQVIDASTNQHFSFEEILDQIAMLFLAGHETTASSLTWTIYLLCLYPNEQQKAYEEIQKQIGTQDFNAQNTRSLKYLQCIFKESLRLYPPVGFFARTNTQQTTLCRKNISKHSGIVVSPWLIHRHSQYWDNPHAFIPSRHERKEFPKDCYLPFGMGERICIGQGFAMQEAILILAHILRRYEICLQENFQPDVVGRLTIRSANGMLVRLQKRPHP